MLQADFLRAHLALIYIVVMKFGWTSSICALLLFLFHIHSTTIHSLMNAEVLLDAQVWVDV